MQSFLFHFYELHTATFIFFYFQIPFYSLNPLTYQPPRINLSYFYFAPCLAACGNDLYHI